MSIENPIASQEKPKALSLERVNAGSISISLPEKFKEMSGDELMGELLVIKNVFEVFLDKNTDILFDVIANVESGSVEIRPLIQDVKIPDELFDVIKGEVEAINASL